MNDRWHVDLQSLQTIEVGNKGFNNAVSITITSKSLVKASQTDMPMLESIKLGSDALDGVLMDNGNCVTMMSKRFEPLSNRSASSSQHCFGWK